MEPKSLQVCNKRVFFVYVIAAGSTVTTAFLRCCQPKMSGLCPVLREGLKPSCKDEPGVWDR